MGATGRDVRVSDQSLTLGVLGIACRYGVQAGEVMKGERDALMKLIGSLRREYEAVMDAKAAQEAELKDLKYRITNVGGAGRNRLLVKGGSSFNGLVRQMKAEMVEASRSTGMPVDPNRVYEVNKMSMDQVQVFPDGELSVQGVDSVAARSGRFAKPIPVAGSTSRPTSPVKKANIPPVFSRKILTVNIAEPVYPR